MLNGSTGFVATIVGSGAIALSGVAMTLVEGFSIAAASVVIIAGVATGIHSVIKVTRLHANLERDIFDLKDIVRKLSGRSDESKADRKEIKERIKWLTKDANLTSAGDHTSPDDD